MKTLDEIKIEVAKENSFQYWWMIENGPVSEQLWPEVCKRYAKECCIATLERASQNADGYTDETILGETFAVIIKSSITNPDNIVL